MIVLAEYECLKCYHRWRKKPSPTVCKKCGHSYIKWLNYDEIINTPQIMSKKERYKEATKNQDPQYVFPMEQYTCNDCKDEETCKCSWDPYNTDLDCLMSK